MVEVVLGEPAGVAFVQQQRGGSGRRARRCVKEHRAALLPLRREYVEVRVARTANAAIDGDVTLQDSESELAGGLGERFGVLAVLEEQRKCVVEGVAVRGSCEQ